MPQKTDSSKPRREQARVFGLRAETLASAVLMLKGYRIVERNYTIRGGEIDIIARRGKTIAFVEVKARPTLDQAALAIDFRKVQRISLAARVWLGRNRWAESYTWRGDAIFIAPILLTRPNSWPRHLIAAYELSM